MAKPLSARSRRICAYGCLRLGRPFVRLRPPMICRPAYVTVAEMLAALERVAGREVAARVRFEPDPAIERIVASWPGAWDDSRARKLGLEGDVDFDSIIRAYIEDDLPGAPAQ